MDKKNVMLLTVIAVATLLVAVVGATFAYFSLTATNTDGTTTATTTTQSLGTIALSNGGQNLYLALTTTQMAEAVSGTTYYATTDTAGAASKTAVEATVVTAKVTGGDNDATYTCTGTLNVALTGDGLTASELSGNVTLTGGSKTTITGSPVSLTSAAATGGVDVTYTMKNISNAATESITANMSFTNTTDTQESLAGKTITTKITSSAFSCTVD